MDNQKFNVGMVVIDIFSKVAVVVPIKSNLQDDVLAGIIEGINTKWAKSPKSFIPMTRAV